ncbi:TPA: hypothetical protein ACNV1G_004560 [Citrobacter amalonaticus]
MAKVIFEFTDINKQVINNGAGECIEIKTDIRIEDLGVECALLQGDLAALILHKMGRVVASLVMDQLAKEYRDRGHGAYIERASGPSGYKAH